MTAGKAFSVAHESTERLVLLKSPVTFRESSDDVKLLSSQDSRDLDAKINGNRNDCPQFQKHDDATLLELFYDLFFAANYTVFSQTQSVNSHARFKAYVGYFCILWMTWLSVSLYDVRYLTDSVFERAAKAVQLGVLVGFAVVAPNFKPENQHVHIMRTMSIILAVSRLSLAVNYGSILWHIRAYKRQWRPMLLQISFNLVSAVIHLFLIFGFKEVHNHTFVAWYVMSCIEVLATFTLSIIYPVLSFHGTHLMKRMTVLTVMILGDGVVIMAQNVVTIVKSPDGWDSQTIGILVAAATTLYFVFLVYFDWMKQTMLPDVRHCLWTLVHFPFHIAMVLFMQGFTQFIIWSKIVDVENHLTFSSIFNDLDAIANSTSHEISHNLTVLVEEFFKTYKIQYYDTLEAVENSLTNLTKISDSFWPQLALYSASDNPSDMPPENETAILASSLATVFTSMENALLGTFGIDLIKELQDGDKADQDELSDPNLQLNLNARTWDRFKLVFCYAYIAAGITLLFMVLLTVISRLKPWNFWSIVRTVFLCILGIGTSLISLLYLNPTGFENYKNSPWLLPAICIVWIIVLLITHLRRLPLSLSESGCGRKSDKRRYDPVTLKISADVYTNV